MFVRPYVCLSQLQSDNRLTLPVAWHASCSLSFDFVNMASVSLFDSLGWSEDQIPSDHLLIIQDACETNSTFLAIGLLDIVFKGSGRVLMLSFESAVAHFFSAARKLGLNLLKQEKENKFLFIDGLTAALPAEMATIKTTSAELPSAQTLAMHGQSTDDVLRDLVRRIGAFLDSQTGGGTTCVWVDGLNALRLLLGSDAAVLRFVHACRSLAAQVCCLFISRAHCRCLTATNVCVCMCACV